MHDSATIDSLAARNQIAAAGSRGNSSNGRVTEAGTGSRVRAMEGIEDILSNEGCALKRHPKAISTQDLCNRALRTKPLATRQISAPASSRPALDENPTNASRAQFDACFLQHSWGLVHCESAPQAYSPPPRALRRYVSPDRHLNALPLLRAAYVRFCLRACNKPTRIVDDSTTLAARRPQTGGFLECWAQ